MIDLQTRKLELIREFLNLQSEELINRLEKLVKSEKKLQHSTPFTLEELNKRIDQSLQDSKDGKLTEVNNLISEIEEWN